MCPMGKGFEQKGSQVVRPEPKWYQSPIARPDLADTVRERTALAASNPSSGAHLARRPKQIASAETSGRRDMKSYLQLLIGVTLVGWVSAGMASETRVVINLSEQRAYLIEQGRVALVSPIASGKPGWRTPMGDFRIFNKDIDHRSRSFGSVLDRWGRAVNSNATPGSHVPP